MVIETLVFNPFQENTYILHDETKECVIIDPGCLEDAEKKYLNKFIADKGLKPVRLLQTHLHLDHVFGTRYVADTWSLKLEAHPADAMFLEQHVSYAASFGVQVTEEPPQDITPLEENDVVSFGNTSLKVISIPGHSPGGIVFYNENDKVLIAGDVLFRESIGRTDLPGGSHDILISSIKSKLLKLDDDVTVYPGHGPATTIGYERVHNMFLK